MDASRRILPGNWLSSVWAYTAGISCARGKSANRGIAPGVVPCGALPVALGALRRGARRRRVPDKLGRRRRAKKSAAAKTSRRPRQRRRAAAREIPQRDVIQEPVLVALE